MRILLAPDKFKGSLTAMEVCRAIEKGLKKSHPDVEVEFHPMADGGDGSLEILSNHLRLEKHEMEVADPLGRKILASYFTSDGSVFIEVASASGLVLLSKNERNPLLTSTFGTGQMMADALARGFRHIYLFLGGSATNDAATGIAHALGFRFLDEKKNELYPNGENLAKTHHIQPSPLFDFREIKMTLLCDVNNPLWGPNGAAHIYAKQKGATDSQIKKLDQGLRHFSEILSDKFGVSVGKLPGGGAAGGIGAGMVAMCGAELRPGFDTISELTHLEVKIKSADHVVSGEGRLDEQSLQGKVIDGVAKLCRKHSKPLSLFVGKNELGKGRLSDLGAGQVFVISDRAKNVEDAMSSGARYLEKMATGFHPSL